MKIGTSLRSSYPVADPREGARWMIERAAAAAAAGLDSLFVGDHHATGPVPYYQNSAILGRLLAEWGDRPAGALYLLPAWNPVLVAEQIGTLAALAQGRFVLQCAVGGGDQM
ncbi:MAG TPA: LLM class flavin-dependent oxidoreductase, partial [Acidimicrobiia bacterium]|nr:LLM class flavin-dependent oxidoreductase [Acidimicrobiia bacterium]